MKIKVSNLGPIRGPAELDLKPLTILIGPNNAGKTWLAYTLAGIFGHYSEKKYTEGDQAEQIAKLYPPLIEAVDKLLTTGTIKINLQQFAEEYGEKYFKNIALNVGNWLSQFMSSQIVSFSGIEISVCLNEAKRHFIDKVLSSSLHVRIGINKEDVLIHIRKKKDQKDLYLFTISENEAIEELPREIEELPREIIEGILAKEILRIFHRSLYTNVVTFPTERATFITFPFNALSEQIPRIRAMEKKENQDLKQDINRSFPIPVSRHMYSAIAVSVIGSKGKIERAKEAEIMPEIKEYGRLAQLLEQEILGGKVDFSDPEPGPKREIVFQPIGSTYSLEIFLASSMVKELSPLVLYLRYLAQPGELLIIDEPEMNLHPKAQVQVLEFLAMLVNAGLHVLVTTHSPYITDHLLSLIKADEHTDKDAISAKFFLQDKRAFISKEQVSFYSVDQGKIIDAMDDNSDWNTFGKVTDRISDIYFSL